MRKLVMWTTIVLLLSAWPLIAAAEQKAVIITAAADYSSGAHSVATVNPAGGPRSITNNINPTISDLELAAYGQHFYVIERYNADNVTKYNIDRPAVPVWQYTTAAPNEIDSSNPSALIFLSETKAYLLRYGSTKAWIVNPSAASPAAFKIGELDLSAYSGPGFMPAMISGIIVNGKLYIVLQRLDADFTPSQTAFIAVFDTATDTEINAGQPNIEGLPGIPLAIRNPMAISFLPAVGPNGRIYVQGSGDYGAAWIGRAPDYTGGIESIDPVTHAVQMVLDDGDAANHPYGNIAGMALISPVKGYFVGYAGWGDNTLYLFNPATGEVAGAVAGFTNVAIAGISSGTYLDENGRLWICNQTHARVDILNTDTNELDESLATHLNPQKVVFCPPTAADPKPDIKANGSDGKITIKVNETPNLTLTLDAGAQSGKLADWWIASYHNGQWQSFVGSTDWVTGFPLTPCLQYGLFNLSQPIPIPLSALTEPGDYSYWFAVDATPDGLLNVPLYFDYVEVTVTAN